MRGAARRVMDLVSQPLKVLSEAVKRILKNIKQAVRTIRTILLSVKRAVMAVCESPLRLSCIGLRDLHESLGPCRQTTP